MKRLFLALMVLSLAIVACGSSEAGEPPAVDEESMIETRVASTVAAALGDAAANATVDIAPTAPALSGDATPLTPIPRLEEPSAEVSPEVEYAEEGQDGQLTFDFGGGATAEPSGSAQTGAAPLGGTAFNSVGSVAATLRDAQFVDSFTTAGLSPQVIAPEAGYRLLWLQYELINLDPNLQLPEHYGGQVLDRDNDFFNCAVYPAEQQPRPMDLILPGFGQPYDSICRIPVTAAAEELDGLRAVIGSNPAVDPIFDLGRGGGVPVDFSTSRPAPTALPASSTDFCPENTDWPYRLEEARWYDAPDAQPPADVLAAAAAWNQQSAAFAWTDNLSQEQFNRLARAATAEERQAVAMQLWQEVWAPYDLTGMDVVALDIVTTNLGKQPSASPIQARSFASFDADDPLSPFTFAGYGGGFNSLLLPFHYLNLTMPPGSEQRTTLLGLVPETANTLYFVHLFNCTGTNNYSDYVVFQVPRQPLTPNEAMSAAGAQPVTVPENLQHMVDDGAVQVVVDAGQARTYSGIMVEADQTVYFAYLDGRWRGGPAADWPMVNSQGDMRVCRKATFPDPDGCLMGLVWGIGDSGVSGTIGINPFGTVTSTGGELWFGPNDDNFSDNAGSVVVLVQLQ